MATSSPCQALFSQEGKIVHDRDLEDRLREIHDQHRAINEAIELLESLRDERTRDTSMISAIRSMNARRAEITDSIRDWERVEKRPSS